MKNYWNCKDAIEKLNRKSRRNNMPAPKWCPEFHKGVSEHEKVKCPTELAHAQGAESKKNISTKVISAQFTEKV